MRQSGSTSRPQQTKASKSPSKESVSDAQTTESICSAVQHYARCISVSVKDMYADCQKGDPSTVIFVVNRVNIPKRKYVRIIKELCHQPMVRRPASRSNINYYC